MSHNAEIFAHTFHLPSKMFDVVYHSKKQNSSLFDNYFIFLPHERYKPVFNLAFIFLIALELSFEKFLLMFNSF